MSATRRPIWCLGGAVWDRKLRLLAPVLEGSSNPVQESATPGGVARNVAQNLRLLGLPAALFTAWGDDAAGLALRADCEALGLQLGATRVLKGAATGSYTAVLEPEGQLRVGLAQLDALNTLDPASLRASAPRRAKAALQLADMNLRRDTLAAWLVEPREGRALLLAVSEAKMKALPDDLSQLDLLIANAGEWQAAGGNTELARRGLRHALVTQGEQGLRCGHWQDGRWHWQRLPALPLDELVDATGAGDAFAAGVLAALSQGELSLERAAAFGQQLSRLALQSLHSVSPAIHPGLLKLFLESPMLSRPAPELLRFSPEVEAARAAGRPLVALESTIVAHGMPWPQNLETARAVESLVRDNGAVPATIAVMDGLIRIGLAEAELTQLAREGAAAMKLSRRDIGYAIAQRKLGATTVAATMLCAHWAGIRVFVTGGIGGVHRGAAQTMDISADLMELARTPVAVVCAGAKSILDLPLTLEVLETNGVPVLAVGQEGFPAFYSRESGLKADFRLDEPAEIAAFLSAHWQLGLDSGVVVANPVPREQEIPAAEVERWITQALAEAAQQGIAGKASTPFMLKRIAELSAGRSLATNIALVKHNAVLGARLAQALK